jgi:two-component system, chemotaxis family, chemotaxis protein CheY
MATPAYNIEDIAFLVVDDNRNMRRIVCQVLRAFGVRRVREAQDGTSALETMTKFVPDMIVTNWMMAPMNGITFAKILRNSEKSEDPFIPIIMLTGYSEMPRVSVARDAGINEFLAKPMSAQTLYNRIATILHRPRNFIRTATYFGPDRRRHKMTTYKGEERRTGDPSNFELTTPDQMK